MRVSDRSDGKIAHLDGLNLSRAWWWTGIVDRLDEADPTRQAIGTTASARRAACVPHIAGDYAGKHWLATFAPFAINVL